MVYFLTMEVIIIWLVLVLWNHAMMQTYPDGKTTMSIYERKASIREFYGEWNPPKWLFTLLS